MTPVILIEILLCVLALAVLVPVSVLLVQVLMALPGDRPREMPAGRRPSIAVVIPAHNEALGIAGTLSDVSSQLEAGDRLLVVADNCTDETAWIASNAGAEVLQRNDRERRGKGYALDFGVRHLESNPPAALVVIDADCRVDNDSIERLARLCVATGRPVQGLDLMLSPHGAGLTTRIAAFAWLVKNHVRVLGCYRLGLPCHLKGTGMAFPWAVIGSAPFASGNIVEDLKLGIDLARSGAPPLYCPEARVTSYFPETADGAAGQRLRWEHGHIAMILGAAPSLFLEALRRRNRDLLALSLDLSVPPLALLALLVLGVFAGSAVFGAFSALWLPLWLAAMSMVLLVLSVLLSWARHGRGVISFSELAYAPFYALRKIPLYARFLVRRQAEWVRSRRAGD